MQRLNTVEAELAGVVRLAPGRCRRRIAVRLQARRRRPLPDSKNQPVHAPSMPWPRDLPSRSVQRAGWPN